MVIKTSQRSLVTVKSQLLKTV